MIRVLPRLHSSYVLAASRRMSVLDSHFSKRPSYSKLAPNSPTAGIIIIGDEILKGHVQDTNSNFLCRRLFALGVKVKKVSVIPDDLETIAAEVAEFSNTYTHVITSGGIGPTHDDMTFEGVAKAFGEKVHPHPELVAVCKLFFGTDDLKSPKLKLAFIPESGELHYGVDKRTGQVAKYPVVRTHNVFIFPGIPQLIRRSFTMLEDLFMNPDVTFHVSQLYVNRDEASITSVLNQCEEKFREKVILGSYPEFYNSYYKVKLTLESEDKEQLEEAKQFLIGNLPQDSLVIYEKDPIGTSTEHVYDLVESKEQSVYHDNIRKAVSTIEKAFDSYRPEEICVGFNGGKDCTVLLHLTFAVFRKKYPDNPTKLQALYIRRGQPFPELELFTKMTKENYHLDIITIHGKIKEALSEVKVLHPKVKAVLMGTRRTDPHSANLSEFAPTDEGWPEYMRVNPMLDWPYSHVWRFMRSLNVPYCTLYDRGYTSMGSMENTHPNPALQIIDEKGIISYKPAYELTDRQSERAGRN